MLYIFEGFFTKVVFRPCATSCLINCFRAADGGADIAAVVPQHILGRDGALGLGLGDGQGGGAARGPRQALHLADRHQATAAGRAGAALRRGGGARAAVDAGGALPPAGGGPARGAHAHAQRGAPAVAADGEVVGRRRHSAVPAAGGGDARGAGGARAVDARGAPLGRPRAHLLRVLRAPPRRQREEARGLLQDVPEQVPQAVHCEYTMVPFYIIYHLSIIIYHLFTYYIRKIDCFLLHRFSTLG